MTENFLIVVTVLEGRYFPDQSGKNVTVEAKFNGEVLTTDPIPLVTVPNFNTELAWEVDRKSLQLFRLQRTPVKLQIFQYPKDIPSSRELMGYLVLDLRLIQERDSPPHWYGLLNARYDDKRPELLIGLRLERDELKEKMEMVTKKPSPPIADHVSSSSDSAKSSSKGSPSEREPPVQRELLMVPILNKEKGYYQIGSPETCKDCFVLSITLAFAANLKPLFSSPALNEKYYFKYSLFGNLVTTEPFYNLEDPDFPAERTSVRIQSSLDVLRTYFDQHHSQEVLFCSGESVVAFALIPYSTLATETTNNLDSPVTEEGTYRLHPLMDGREPYSSNLQKDFPMLGVSVTLRKKQPSLETVKQVSDPNIRHESSASQSQKDSRKSTTSHSPPQKLAREDTASTKSSETMHSAESSLTAETDKVISKPTIPKPSTSNLNHEVDLQVTSRNDTLPHHYCFSLDLRNLLLKENSPKFHCCLRYSYPFFGSSSPILTHPAIEVRPNMDITLPHSFCAFNFATVFHQLQATFLSIPLIVEMLHEDRPGSSSYSLIGISKLDLYPVLEASPMSLTHSEKKGTRRLSTCSVPVLNPEGNKLGDLHCIMSLEDYGTVNVPQLLTDTQALRTETVPRFPPSKPESKETKTLPHPLTEEEFIQVAMELEAWKERQEILFREQLKKREQEHLNALTAEWKKRDAERELILHRRDQECQKLEAKLKAALSDIEMQEKQFKTKEMELSKQRTEMQIKYEQLQGQCKEDCRKAKAEYDYFESIHRKRQHGLEEEIGRLQEKVEELYKKLKDREKTIDLLMDEKKNNQEGRLHKEIHILTTEKSDLERKLEEALASKQRYKERWARALQHNAQFQHRLHVQERAELARKESELEALHLQVLSAKERQELQKEQDELKEIKERADRLKIKVQDVEKSNHLGNGSVTTESQDAAHTSGSMKPKTDVVTTLPSSYIQRLIEERETLLKTGFYTENDRVIVELTQLINKGTSLGEKS